MEQGERFCAHHRLDRGKFLVTAEEKMAVFGAKRWQASVRAGPFSR